MRRSKAPAQPETTSSAVGVSASVDPSEMENFPKTNHQKTIDNALQHDMFEKTPTSKYFDFPTTVRALGWTKQNFEV